jgi:hypothetical protein
MKKGVFDMNLKPQDIVIALKIVARNTMGFKYSELAHDLCMSISEISVGLNRLRQAKLFPSSTRSFINLVALEEFVIHGIKYVFMPEIGGITRGIPTSYGAPVLKKKLAIKGQPIPVWPHPEGNTSGYRFSPLFRKVPESIIKYPDQKFYDLLALVDAIRHGQARESNIAKKIITNLLKGE